MKVGSQQTKLIGHDETAPAPDLAQIANVFLRHANFTMGGGSLTAAAIHQQLVEKRQWVRQDDFTLCFALARLIPGTNLLAFCTGLGWVLRQIPGAIVALLAASVPCTLMVVLLTVLFDVWQDNVLVSETLRGAMAGAVALTVKTAWIIAKPHANSAERTRLITIGSAAFVLYVFLKIPAIEVLLLAGAIGLFLPPVHA
ncbi:chromate transporter [Beijerinckia indica]|uniref:Chromate transporter n=1 Tax=Beijerinckia indica subsp. indica (strain ATCC 9039 / DSM 1715 / NCIMB 8712) TaxID=395963 RepID=B2IFT7_BEII9|nr:chromate transporter [Beijerinckia indica]ACB94298.1 Chromate transporter [Beijerinckia indica subsp. indica ATCC 9039]